LNIVRHELELICDAAKIPDEIVIDVTGLMSAIRSTSATLRCLKVRRARSPTVTSPSPPSLLLLA
jgi:hypothetical protein